MIIRIADKEDIKDLQQLYYELENDAVRERDRKKNQICKDHHFELIRVENTYARRYHYIKDILIKYFAS